MKKRSVIYLFILGQDAPFRFLVKTLQPKLDLDLKANDFGTYRPLQNLHVGMRIVIIYVSRAKKREFGISTIDHAVTRLYLEATGIGRSLYSHLDQTLIRDIKRSLNDSFNDSDITSRSVFLDRRQIHENRSRHINDVSF